jgi:DNA polymerase-4
VSLRLSGVDQGETQLEIFARTEERRRRLAGVMDKLNETSKSPIVTHGHQLGIRRD